ncbi:MAG TPA: DUF1080 domain-containing protein [Terriglobia bacterium]|nr:DUF1080 domain-containing protein [Terriglobia bacterium]
MSTRYIALLVSMAACVTALVFSGRLAGDSQRIFSPGYQDTPMLPGGKWHVHDSKRPHPQIVTPGTCGTQDHPGRPPSDAVVLFDGTDLSKWRSEKGQPAAWKVENGYMEVVPKTGDLFTREDFGDIQLHVEWSTPAGAQGENPSWGNSGVFLYGVYEVQVWDSYHTNNIYADGQAGAVYGQYPPLVNASRKPGEWQEFDILFSVPRFAGGKLQTPPYLTVFHNGVVIHNHTPLLGETGHRMLPPFVDHGLKGPIRLQDHGDLVRYRNIWVRPLKDYDMP